MNQLDVDASNSCIPPSHPLCGLFVPLPSTTRGEPTVLDGTGGRLNSGRPLLLYGSGRLVIVRELSKTGGNIGEDGDGVLQCKNGGTIQGCQDVKNHLIHGFVYRGHGSTVTVAKFSPSGAYVASGDTRGCIRIWSYDNDEHLCKLNVKGILSGPIRDIAWDADGKRVCIVGEAGGGEGGVSAKIVQWDTAVSCGELGQHFRGRVMTCDLNHRRPFRCMTGGEDTNTLLSGNTPFVRILVSSDQHISTSKGHSREVNCLRFSNDSEWICSVGGDKVIRLYHGKEGHCVYERRPTTNASDGGTHEGAIYACAWSSNNHLLTCSSDGTAKLWSITGTPNDPPTVDMTLVHTWDVAKDELTVCGITKPPTIQPMTTNPSQSNVLSPTAGKAPVVQVPKGAMQCGCAFVYEHQPVVVEINGQLTLLNQPNSSSDNKHVMLTGHQGNLSAMVVLGTFAYTADIDGIIVEWNLMTGSCRRVIPSSAAAAATFPNLSINDGDSKNEAPSSKPNSQQQHLSANHLMYQVHSGAITSLVALKFEDTTTDPTILSVGWDDMVRCSYNNNHNQLQCMSSTKLPSQPSVIAAGTHLLVIVTVKGLLYKYIGGGGSGGSIASGSSTQGGSCPPSPRRQGGGGTTGAPSSPRSSSPRRPMMGGRQSSSSSLTGATTVFGGYSEMEIPYVAQSVAVTSDDSLVVVGSDDGDIYFYKPMSRKSAAPSKPKSNVAWTQVHVVQSAHFKGVTALAFSDDNSTLASADVRDVCVWNVSDVHNHTDLSEKGQHTNNVVPIISKNRWCFHTQKITCLAWMPPSGQASGSSILASAGQDDQIYLWSLQKKMKRINYNYVHRGGVVGLSFIHNGKVLVSAGKDGCLCQWNVVDDIKAKFGVTL